MIEIYFFYYQGANNFISQRLNYVEGNGGNGMIDDLESSPNGFVYIALGLKALTLNYGALVEFSIIHEDTSKHITVMTDDVGNIRRSFCNFFNEGVVEHDSLDDPSGRLLRFPHENDDPMDLIDRIKRFIRMLVSFYMITSIDVIHQPGHRSGYIL